jgi:hypothetical protein
MYFQYTTSTLVDITACTNNTSQPILAIPCSPSPLFYVQKIENKHDISNTHSRTNTAHTHAGIYILEQQQISPRQGPTPKPSRANAHIQTIPSAELFITKPPLEAASVYPR